VTHENTAVAVSLIVLFFFTQRTSVQGITMTGLKG
jgi:ABC-type maltose transport system permease subunit